MNKFVVWSGALLALVGVGGASFWLGARQSALSSSPATSSATKAAAPAAAPAATAVEVFQVKPVKLLQSITAVGSLRSDESVIVRPEVSGRISEILFREGEPIHQGATLIRLDASVQRAELRQAEANLSLSQSKLERARDLQKQGFVSSQARDEAENNFRVAQAAYDLSAARLTKLEIKAPFSGVVGLRLVSIGDYVKDGQDLVNLEGIDPLKVDFKVPEVYLRQVAVGQALQIGLDAFPNQLYQGRVLAINPLLDQNGRSIVIRAAVKNGEARLRPGMFARVLLLLNETRDSLAVPEQSLIPVGDEHFLFRVVDGHALRTKVVIGQRREGQVEVLQGLSAGDLVVTAGQLKLRDGATVKVVAGPAVADKKKGG